jgi:23S rRNA-/tRNA-specific pseudouridylate synthase
MRPQSGSRYWMNSNNPLFYKTVHEDDTLLIVDKPQGLATTPGRSFYLCEYVFAKTNESFHYYSLQMKTEKVIKYYTAVVRGCPKVQNGIITLAIAHHHKSKKKMAVADGTVRYRGKPQQAVTRWKLLRLHEQGAILEIMLKKGVRHQIRVHLSAAGMPIAGDKLYGETTSGFFNHQLYATGVKLVTIQGKKLVLKIEAPF